MMRCPSCNASLGDSALQCPNCGGFVHSEEFRELNLDQAQAGSPWPWWRRRVTRGLVAGAVLVGVIAFAGKSGSQSLGSFLVLAAVILFCVALGPSPFRNSDSWGTYWKRQGIGFGLAIVLLVILKVVQQ